MPTLEKLFTALLGIHAMQRNEVLLCQGQVQGRTMRMRGKRRNCEPTEEDLQADDEEFFDMSQLSCLPGQWTL
jgi:hypothetical protein